MSPHFLSHQLTIWAVAATGVLLLVQLLVADVAGLKAAEHRAGFPIPPDPESFLFRAARAHANTNESIAAFALFALAGVLGAASPVWLGGFAWLYVIARAAHMLAYYGNLKLPRSGAFVVSLVALGGMVTSIAFGGGAA